MPWCGAKVSCNRLFPDAQGKSGGARGPRKANVKLFPARRFSEEERRAVEGCGSQFGCEASRLRGLASKQTFWLFTRSRLATGNESWPHR